jgi:DNA polymerase-3 subunit beta
MKIQIQKQILSNALKTCCNSMDAISFNPVGDSILIKTTNNELHLQTSTANASLLVKIKEGIQISEDGEVLIKGRLLYNIITKTHGNDIRLETVDNSVLRIEVARFSSDINLSDSTLFPHVNFQFDSWKKCEIESNFLKEVISKLVPCATTTETKNIACNTILLDTTQTPGIIQATGTDGNHLAHIQQNYSGEQFKLILGIQNLKQIIDFLDNKTITFFINNKNIVIHSSGAHLLLRTIEGEYPDLTKPLQAQHPNKIVCTTNTLLNAVEKATLLASADKKPAVQLNILDKTTKITARSIEYGSTLEEIDIDNQTKTTQSFTFNAKYLMNLLKNINTKNLIFEFSTPNKPVLIKEENNSNYTSLLLPIINL